MKHLIEIAGIDIAALNDSDLRELVGLLSEAELNQHKISPQGVTWGGHQNAKDGGIDVSVVSERAVGFLPRQKTGFQVKKPDMTPAAIIEEMRPNGLLRDCIKSLIAENGSYIIVSSTGSTSDSALAKRREAMRKAVKDEPNNDNLLVDFYDRNRIATWVRILPSLVLWVRNRIGRSLQGWKSFENWSNIKQGNEEYIFDKEVRLYNGTSKNKGQELSIEDGITSIRQGVSKAGICIRLAGLSGVGKTRFAQALFDSRIGVNPLNPSSVLYTDMSDGPEPDPKFMAEQLLAQQSSGILIVDNCPPELHKKLAQVCSSSKSTLSLLTIEYDVRDDLPEETKVFRMEPASIDVITKLIKRRFGHISEIDTKTIAVFSGGNARLAVALSNTVQIGSTLSGFQNEELFDRLFYQRNRPDEQLLLSAQILSLIYSFNGEDVSDTSELSILGSLIGRSASDMYRDVAHLHDRELVQSRSKWRAVLPHALANRLAKQALKVIPVESIKNVLMQTDRERLLKSFAHRLSFLHDSLAATQIANTWLDKNGWLSQVHTFNDLGMRLFEYIAPLSPEKVLHAIEEAAVSDPKFTMRSNTYHYKISQLLRLLAYDHNLFLKSARLLSKFALNEKKDEKSNSSREVLKSLFPLYLSGNHASAETRYCLIEGLLTSKKQPEQVLGISLLNSALEAVRFSSIYDSSFGARPRDNGYTPQSFEERKEWYKYFINKSVDLIEADSHLGLEIKQVLGNNFRGLWCKMGLYDELEAASKQIMSVTSWNLGWVQVKKTLRYNGKKLPPDILKRLFQIEKLLNPSSLVEKVRTYALSDSGQHWDLVEIDEDDLEVDPLASQTRVEEITIELGVQLVEDNETFKLMLTDLLTTHGYGVYRLGEGIAIGAKDRLGTWEELTAKVGEVEIDKLNLGVLMGYINQMSRMDTTAINCMLDSVYNDPILCRWLPRFQCAAGIDEQGLERLYKTVNNRISPIAEFSCIAYGRSHESIDDNSLAAFFSNLLEYEGGDHVVLAILNMRFHGDKGCEKTNSKIVEVSRRALAQYRFDYKGSDITLVHHGLSRIAKVALAGKDAYLCATQLCHHLLKSIDRFEVLSHNYEDLFIVIAEKQPNAFLNVFVDRKYKGYSRDIWFNDPFDRHSNPLDKIEGMIIIDWCEEEPSTRYDLITEDIDPFQVVHPKDADQAGEKFESRLTWKPIIYLILEKTLGKQNILNKLESWIYPSSWSDSLADVLQQRVGPIKEFTKHDDPIVRSWAQANLLKLQSSIIKQRQSEKDEMRYTNESFE